MKQVLQNFKSGELAVSDVPSPVVRSNGVLVRTRASLISAGTERSVVEFAEKNILDKARSRPDLVKQVLAKAQREGLLTTYEAVQNRLEQWVALGYSSAGEVIEVGAGASGFNVGDRVACAGMGYASHAEFAYVPRNLAVKIPKNVSFEEASFCTLGAIALQGVRQAEVTIGDKVGVIGLGLLGKLTAQILQASGCQVMGIDISPRNVDEAFKAGCDATALTADAAQKVIEFTQGHGLDRVIITASAKDSQPVELAGEIARDKGVVVIVGDVGMEIPRRPFYMKELDLRLSRSYGPGRYDAAYEEQGHDYPFAYVRWTEQRNMQAFLALVASGKVKVADQISHRFPIDEANEAYDLITGRTGQAFASVILTYPADRAPARKIERPSAAPTSKHAAVKLGVIGAGSFAAGTLLPAIKATEGIETVGIASANGVSARSMADRHGFAFCATSADEILNDTRVNAVAILTRHDLHAKQVIAALTARKAVFVEKPLAMDRVELDAIAAAHAAAGAPPLLVGFNRRFAPFSRELEDRLRDVQEPKMISIRVNGGFIPPEHWIHDPKQGGGRLLGEACHFFDLLHYFTGAPAESVHTTPLENAGRYRQDNFVSVVRFADGSVGTLTYVANGDRQTGKERIEVFAGGLSTVIDDFSRLQIHQGAKSVDRKARLRADKGHRAEWEAFAAEITGKGPRAMTLDQAMASMLTTFAAQESLLTGELVRVGESAPRAHGAEV